MLNGTCVDLKMGEAADLEAQEVWAGVVALAVFNWCRQRTGSAGGWITFEDAGPDRPTDDQFITVQVIVSGHKTR